MKKLWVAGWACGSRNGGPWTRCMILGLTWSLLRGVSHYQEWVTIDIVVSEKSRTTFKNDGKPSMFAKLCLQYRKREGEKDMYVPSFVLPPPMVMVGNFWPWSHQSNSNPTVQDTGQDGSTDETSLNIRQDRIWTCMLRKVKRKKTFEKRKRII